jgi:predicted small secreted protein
MTTPKIIAAIALGTIALATAACNTVEGAGEDLQSASREVKEEI